MSSISYLAVCAHLWSTRSRLEIKGSDAHVSRDLLHEGCSACCTCGSSFDWHWWCYCRRQDGTGWRRCVFAEVVCECRLHRLTILIRLVDGQCPYHRVLPARMAARLVAQLCLGCLCSKHLLVFWPLRLCAPLLLLLLRCRCHVTSRHVTSRRVPSCPIPLCRVIVHAFSCAYPWLLSLSHQSQ